MVFDYQILLHSSWALNHCRDVAELGDTLGAIVTDRFDVDCHGIFMRDQSDGGRFRLLVGRGAPEFELGHGILWQLLSKGEPVALEDEHGHRRFGRAVESMGSDGLVPTILVPLTVGRDLAGVIALGRPGAGRALDDRDMEFLWVLGEQASVALGSVFMYQELEEKRRELDRTVRNLSILYDISRALSRIEDMRALLVEILDRAIGSVGASRGSIMLHDPSDDRLKLRVVRGLSDPAVEDGINSGRIACRSFRPGEGIAGQVFLTGEPYVSNDVSTDELFVPDVGSHVRSIACLPLLVNESSIGVLNITNKPAGQGDGPLGHDDQRGPVGFGDEDLEILTAIANQAAITIEKADLYRLAVTDALTGLYVRRYFNRRLDHELRRRSRYGTPMSVLMMDVDRFKEINDRYGHEAGDRVMVGLARVLTNGSRTVDVVSRYGGDEFTVLLPETGLVGAMEVAQRLGAGVRAMRVVYKEHALKVTVSVGVYEARGEGETASRVLHRADLAMYRAKREGRDRVVAWTEELEQGGRT